jgi:hypothetical protein
MSLNPCMGCEGDFAGIVDAICEHCRVDLVDALTHDMEPEIPLSTRDPLTFLAVLGGQLAGAVAAVEMGEAPAGWEHDRIDPRYFWRHLPHHAMLERVGMVWRLVVDATDLGMSFGLALVAMWHATDPTWIDRAKAESAAWTGNGRRS